MSALRRVFPAVLLLLLSVLWAGAIKTGGTVSSLPDCSLLRYHTRSFTWKELQQLEKSEEQYPQPLPFSAFSQLDAQPVKSTLYGRSTQADILLFYGDIRRILQAGLPDSDFVSSEDASGCALDRETAFALWGNGQVIGEKLLFEGREYTVRAVLDAPKRMVAIPISEASEHSLSVIALGTLEQQNVRQAAEEFAVRHSLPSPEALTAGGWRRSLSRFLCLLPALPLLFWLLGGIIRELWGLRKTPLLCALWSLGTAAVLCGLLILSGIRFSFPQSLVPTRWSDFEFWSRLLHSFFENLRSALLTPALAPDRAMGAALGRQIFCSLAAAADMIALLALYKRKEK